MVQDQNLNLPPLLLKYFALQLLHYNQRQRLLHAVAQSHCVHHPYRRPLMKVINAPEASAGIVQSILDPIKSILRTTNNLCKSAEVCSEIVLESAELVKEISLLSLSSQRDELLSRRATLSLT